jgi:PST family polysaccharide transporter
LSFQGERPIRTLLQSLFFKALPSPLEKACRLLLVVVAAPMLGAAAFGTYQFATTIGVLLSTGAELGLGTWTTRAVARDVARAAPIVSAGMRLRLGTVTPALIVLALIALAQGKDEARTAVAILGAAALASSFVDYLGAVLRGYEDFRREAMTNVARALLTTGGGLGGLLVTRSLTGLAAGLLFGALMSAAVGGAALYLRSDEGRGGRLTERDPPSTAARIPMGELLPLWLAGLLSTLYFRCDVVLLRAFVGDAEIGYYGAAYRIFEATTIVPATLMAVAFPRLAQAGQSASRAGGWTRLEVQLLAALGGLGLAAGAGLHLASDRLVSLTFGADFARAATSLRILSVSAPFLFLNFGVTFFLFARGLERRYLGIVGAMFALNVATNLVAIPRSGGPGAAWATLVTEAALALACALALGRPTPPRDDPARSAPAPLHHPRAD